MIKDMVNVSSIKEMAERLGISYMDAYDETYDRVSEVFEAYLEFLDMRYGSVVIEGEKFIFANDLIWTEDGEMTVEEYKSHSGTDHYFRSAFLASAGILGRDDVYDGCIGWAESYDICFNSYGTLYGDGLVGASGLLVNVFTGDEYF